MLVVAEWQELHTQFTDRASDSGLAEIVEMSLAEPEALISEAQFIVGAPAKKTFRKGSNAEQPRHQTVMSPVSTRIRMRTGPARRAIPED